MTTEAKVEYLERFKTTLEANGVIAKDDVITLEAYVGSDFLTRECHLNSYSDQPTKINFKRTLGSVNDMIQQLRSQIVPFNPKKQLVATSINLAEYLTRFASSVGNLLKLIGTIEEQGTNIYDDVWNVDDFKSRLREAIDDRSIRYYYDAEKILRDKLDHDLLSGLIHDHTYAVDLMNRVIPNRTHEIDLNMFTQSIELDNMLPLITSFIQADTDTLLKDDIVIPTIDIAYNYITIRELPRLVNYLPRLHSNLLLYVKNLRYIYNAHDILTNYDRVMNNMLSLLSLKDYKDEVAIQVLTTLFRP